MNRSNWTATMHALYRRILCGAAVHEIFADACRDGGFEELGEFVGVQCELAVVKGTQAPNCERAAEQLRIRGRPGEAHAYISPDGKLLPCSGCWDSLRRRERELLEANCEKWVPELSDGPARFIKTCCVDNLDTRAPQRCPIRVKFARGFISSITCSWSTWLDIAPKVYWRPVKCERCGGSGIGCDGRIVSFGNPRLVDGAIETQAVLETNPCHTCRGTGSVEPTMECPDTALPLEEVTLTPFQVTYGTWRGPNTGKLYSISSPNDFQNFLKEEWPSLTFSFSISDLRG